MKHTVLPLEPEKEVMVMVRSFLIIVTIFFLCLSLACARQNPPTPRVAADDMAEAVRLVEKAAAFMKENGKEKAIAEMSNPQGRFVMGELYVFAYDLNGVLMAHPKNPKLIGQSLIDKTDSKGKLFRKEIIEKAKSQGSGWVDYFYLNPVTKKEEDKTTYLRRVEDLVICCGVYK